MRVISAGKTNIGRIRERNEDNLFLDGRYFRQGAGPDGEFACGVQNPVHLYAVSDGMGGGSCGDEAALLAMQVLEAHYYAGLSRCVDARQPEAAAGIREQGVGSPEQLENYVQAANRRICAEMEARSIRNMGATVALLYLAGGRATVCNLGDSRVYLSFRGELEQLTEDHRSSGWGGRTSVLSQHLGIPPEEFLPEPHVLTDIRLEPGMVFLLCSDGVTDMVSDAELQVLLETGTGNAPVSGADSGAVDRPEGWDRPGAGADSGAGAQAGTPAAVAEAVIDAALAAGGRDNATAVVVKVVE